MPKLLNIEANQRVDVGDFAFLATSPNDHAKHAVENFVTNPDGTRVWVLSGFATDNPSANQIRVTRGTALLATKEGGVTKYGYVTTEGDASKTIDIAAYTNATYGIYIRFEYQDGDDESRIFWNATGLGSEFAQSTPTRLTPGWSMRIEASNPGSEWLKIGEVVKSGSPPAITDMRPFYFEGVASATYANTWGAGNDRSDNRATYGVRDLQTFTAAMRTKLEDLQGEGKRWWLAPTQSLSGKVGADAIASFVVTGLTTAATAGLAADTAVGIAYAGGHRVQKTATTSKTYTASKDTYVDLSSTGAFTYTAVTNGAAAPAIAASSVRLAKVVTDGTTVTGVTDLRPVADLAFGPDSVGAAVGKELHFLRANGTLTAPTIVASGETLGQVTWRGFDGVQYRSGAAIRAAVDGTPGAGDMPGRLSFWVTENGTATLVERARLSNAGDLGLNTTSFPVGAAVAGRNYLAVKGTTKAGGVEFQTAEADADGTVLGIAQFSDINSTSTEFRRATIVGFLQGSTATKRGGRLGFYTVADNSDTLVQRLDIAQDGRVAIGAPAAAYDSFFSVESTIGATVARFGPDRPLYITGADPNIGFNAYYYNAAWRYGKGSTAHYAGMFGFAPSTGVMQWLLAASSGAADAAITFTTVATLDLTSFVLNNALDLTPQTLAGSTAGRAMVDSTTKKLNIHNGYEFGRYVPQVFALTTRESLSANSTFSNTQYIIRANTLKAGSVVHVRLAGKKDTNVTGGVVNVVVNGVVKASVGLAAGWGVGTYSFFLDVAFTVRVADGALNLCGESGHALYQDGATSTPVPIGNEVVNFESDVSNTLTVSLTNYGGSGSVHLDSYTVTVT